MLIHLCTPICFRKSVRVSISFSSCACLVLRQILSGLYGLRALNDCFASCLPASIAWADVSDTTWDRSAIDIDSVEVDSSMRHAIRLACARLAKPMDSWFVFLVGYHGKPRTFAPCAQFPAIGSRQILHLISTALFQSKPLAPSQEFGFPLCIERNIQ